MNKTNQNKEGTKPPQQTNQKNEQKLSRRQFFFIIIQTQIGVGVLSVPYELHTVAKQDGWISLLLGAVAIQLLLVGIWFVAKNLPQDTLYTMNDKLYTKWIGRPLSILYILYFIGVGTLIILLFCRMINVWVLPNTPIWVTALLMITVCMYMVHGGLLVLGRMYTMLSILIVFLLILMVFGAKEMQIMYLFPILETGWGKVFSGINQAIFSYFGFIVTLVVYSKVEGTHKQKLTTIVLAHWFVTLFYLFTVLASYTFFSTSELPLVPEPVLYMLKSFSLPVVARIDLFFITIWVINVATSFATYLYLSSIGLSDLFKKQSKTKFIVLIGVVVFSICMFIDLDIKKMEAFNKVVTYSGYVFSVALPLIMVPLSFWRRKKDKGEGAS
ncbi:endospore germination permease [Halobacillus sp. GSS1]|uniref:GerAB/ArcD/ProY family transporter n=1 Tax=Halobacillus sp. GSS1 TaxID=2815919 RepID=UPI001A8C7105|nr:endospore germination permease [Halobacillus sp. GSS1]MBN9656134.1 endospore germination permease [Halobacillus sp. GSS1]